MTVIEEQQPLGGDGSSGFFNSSPTNAAVNRLFKFEAFGSRFILRTKPDSQFLAEDVIVTYGRQNDSWAHMVAPSTRRCFHVGQEPGSKVVLNVCNGLVSITFWDRKEGRV